MGRFFSPFSLWSVVPVASRTVTVTTNNDKTGYALAAGASGWSAIKSIQYGSITMTSPATTNTATISAVTTAKTALLFLGSYAANTAANAQCVITLTNTTTVTATRSQTGDNCVVNFCAVEFY